MRRALNVQKIVFNVKRVVCVHNVVQTLSLTRLMMRAFVPQKPTLKTKTVFNVLKIALFATKKCALYVIVISR